ncbi:hypothetical protein M8J75_012743 [Diaphorina citri]|nr:hypothetical protein M8J75_012743 [Diaphorina citri]
MFFLLLFLCISRNRSIWGKLKLFKKLTRDVFFGLALTSSITYLCLRQTNAFQRTGYHRLGQNSDLNLNQQNARHEELADVSEFERRKPAAARE